LDGFIFFDDAWNREWDKAQSKVIYTRYKRNINGSYRYFFKVLHMGVVLFESKGYMSIDRRDKAIQKHKEEWKLKK
jgi:hypothetical protein